MTNPWPDPKLEQTMLFDADNLEALEMACHVRALLARVRALEALIEEFADFCDDSGWRNVAQELRERAKGTRRPA